MATILMLCHRLPWPPNKGDKIRSFHVLRHLAERHRVYLGSFIDDPDDWRHVAEVEAVCAGVCIRPLQPWTKRVRALGALARGEALTLGCYRDGAMQRWVDGVLAAQRPDAVLCFSSGVAPFVLARDGMPRVMDFVDADSDKWRQYAQARRGVSRWLFRREAARLSAFEHAVATRFDASMFVSESEAAFFRAQVPASAASIHGIANGVDGDFWNPERGHDSPYAEGERALAFVGAMDYRANVDAVQWFAHEVWPRIAAARADARFVIVGAHPAREVRSLAALERVTVTGAVDDVRPYVAHAHAVVASLRIARGIQNKVLEALAMEKVVLATPTAWEGIDDFDGRRGCISDDPAVIAEEALRALDRFEPARVPAARAMVRERFDWARNLDAYEHVLLSAIRGNVPSAAPTVGA